MFPRKAFREILLNAVIHKDYGSCNPIQISVYDDKMYIWNDGTMPEELASAENLFEKHSSIPFNPKLAGVFFKSGMVETWGRGFEKIKEACDNHGTPLPEYKISSNGVMVLCKPNERYMSLLRGKSIVESSLTNDFVSDISTDKIASGEEVANRIIYDASHNGEMADKTADNVSNNDKMTDKTADNGRMANKPADNASNKDKVADKTTDNMTNKPHKQRILDYLAEHDEINTGVAAKIIGRAPKTTRTILSKLAVEGVLVQIGANRNRRYKLP